MRFVGVHFANGLLCYIINIWKQKTGNILSENIFQRILRQIFRYMQKAKTEKNIWLKLDWAKKKKSKLFLPLFKGFRANEMISYSFIPF